MTRRTAGVLIGLNLVALAGLVGFHVAAPPEPPTLAPQGSRAVLGALVGQVEVRRQGTKVWSVAQIGVLLEEGDEVRTGLFSEASLLLKGASEVTVDPNSSFVVGREKDLASAFELAEGRITADLARQGEREYLFYSRGSDAVATGKAGEFSVATDGKGTVVVDALEGEVKLVAKGGEVLVPKGRRSIVLPDAQPAPVLPIPSSVALQVRWPAAKTDKTSVRLEGSTVAGAVVMVNGLMVRADGAGSFQVDVPLREGPNKLVVNATDNAGNAALKESPTILVDTKPPALDVDAKGLWK
ncbi:MAG TPA: FecR domain-containing protein [Myxococcota bacterium]|nr:FecR domain-containing protein [Myxococcota bacterium]HRY91919.1 FecR domain-containing protein [Myxococcota bacterium]HSA21103.1 FecR domain-containing protein [Myxococcota bacterium]